MVRPIAEVFAPSSVAPAGHPASGGLTPHRACPDGGQGPERWPRIQHVLLGATLSRFVPAPKGTDRYSGCSYFAGEQSGVRGGRTIGGGPRAGSGGTGTRAPSGGQPRPRRARCSGDLPNAERRPARGFCLPVTALPSGEARTAPAAAALTGSAATFLLRHTVPHVAWLPESLVAGLPARLAGSSLNRSFGRLLRREAVPDVQTMPRKRSVRDVSL